MPKLSCRRSLLAVCAVLTFMFSSTLNAQVVEGGDKVITAMRFDTLGVLVALWPAPSNCNGGAQYRMHARLESSHPNYNALVSALLTLRTTNKPITHIWFENEGITCDATNILTINLIEY